MKKLHIGPKMLIGFCLLVGLVILCIPKKKTSAHLTMAGTMERTVEDIFLTTINEQLFNIKKGFHSLKNNSECFIIEVNYQTHHSSKILILDDAVEFLKKIFTDARCNQIEVINLYPHSVLIDKYGKESVDQIAMLQLNRTSASKINWSNVGSSLLEKLLSSEGVLWFHNCLKD